MGYASGAVGYFIPHRGFLDVQVLGSEGRAYALDNGQSFEVRHSLGSNADGATTRRIYAHGEAPTVNTIRDLIPQETGEDARQHRRDHAVGGSPVRRRTFAPGRRRPRGRASGRPGLYIPGG